MAKFQWKTIDEIEQEEVVNEINQLAEEQENNRRKLLDDFLEMQAEEYLLNADVPDEEKNRWISIFEPFRVGVNYPIGKKIQYDGTVYEVIQSHTTQADWLPSDVPSLFKVFLQGETEDGTEVIHDWKEPAGGHDAYNAGDKVRFEGSIYESTINNNVWSPSSYPQGWALIEG